MTFLHVPQLNKILSMNSLVYGFLSTSLGLFEFVLVPLGTMLMVTQACSMKKFRLPAAGR